MSSFRSQVNRGVLYYTLEQSTTLDTNKEQCDVFAGCPVTVFPRVILEHFDKQLKEELLFGTILLFLQGTYALNLEWESRIQWSGDSDW